MARPKLTLYLDVISPFAYIAYYFTRNNAIFKDVDITYTPVFLGGIMKACNNTAPLNIKNKDKWIEVERQRFSRLLSVPISRTPPKPFPQPTLNTQRALTHISLHHPKLLPAAFDACYEAFWQRGVKIGDAAEVRAALAPVFEGVEGGVEGVLKGMGSDEAKKALGERSEEAMGEGAFGLPWFVVEDGKGGKEGLWGVDHLGMVVEKLGLDKGRVEGLRAML